MLVCDLEPDGSAPWELLRKFGGKFGLFEKIRMGGVGSPKIKYASGLEGIDDFVEDTAGSDIPYVNFEYLKNGILVRVNKTQYLKGVLINFDEISNIVLTISQKLLNKGNLLEEMEKIGLDSAKLEIQSSQGQTLTCEVSTQSYMGLRKYFQKNKSVRGKFAEVVTA
ncbi:MAG: hypothetical protein AAF573_13670 [Bacteroidota bacterium]